jgi:hypothetical protein
MCSPFNDGSRKGDFTRMVEDIGKGIFGFIRERNPMCKQGNVIRLFWFRLPFLYVAALWSFFRNPCGGE